MAFENIYIKRGSTLRVQIPLGFDLTNYAVSAAAKTRVGVFPLDVRKIDSGVLGLVEISAEPIITRQWPQGNVPFDLVAELAGEVVASETYNIIAITGVTE